ncbi:putative aminotransferase, partial [Streptomyces sparsogenes DSM 40356]
TLRVRLSTLPLLGTGDQERLAALAAADPLRLPHVAEALTAFETAFRELTRTGPRPTGTEGSPLP